LIVGGGGNGERDKKGGATDRQTWLAACHEATKMEQHDIGKSTKRASYTKKQQLESRVE